MTDKVPNHVWQEMTDCCCNPRCRANRNSQSANEPCPCPWSWPPQDPLPSKELPERLRDPMKVLDRGERICALMDEINADCGSIRVAGRFVDLQDRIAKLESDIAWIRRRTGFWSEVPEA